MKFNWESIQGNCLEILDKLIIGINVAFLIKVFKDKEIPGAITPP